MKSQDNKSLDYLASYISQQIVKIISGESEKVSSSDLENLATKALGILKEQGIYAMALFLYSKVTKPEKNKPEKTESKVALEILRWLHSVKDPFKALKKLTTKNNLSAKGHEEMRSERDDILSDFSNLSTDLHKLLLVRDLFEQILIYTRYHAKALSKEA